MLVSSNYAKSYPIIFYKNPLACLVLLTDIFFPSWMRHPNLSLFIDMSFQGYTPVNLVILELGF